MTSYSSTFFANDAFDTFDVTLPTKDASESVTVHGIASKHFEDRTDLPPLLLLHGHPQTHIIWRHVAPLLTAKYRLLIPDLRGHGQSSKPNIPEDTSHDVYSKRSMAQDQVSLFKHFGVDKFYIVAHDRGARVAHRLALDHPQAVEKILILDIAPTLAMYEKADHRFATAYYHWFMLLQPSPVPEAFLGQAPEAYLGRAGLGEPSQAFESEALAEYRAQFEDVNAVHAMCEDYRASGPGGVDLVRDAEDRDAGRKVEAPLRLLWSKTGTIERLFSPLDEWSAVCEHPATGRAVPTGHFVAEELDPKELQQEIDGFFGI